MHRLRSNPTPDGSQLMGVDRWGHDNLRLLVSGVVLVYRVKRNPHTGAPLQVEIREIRVD